LQPESSLETHVGRQKGIETKPTGL
jgi:hypothetical protein